MDQPVEHRQRAAGSVEAASPSDVGDSALVPRNRGHVVRDEHGIEAAQGQLSHARKSTTEQYYAQRRTTGPDVRAALDKFAGRAG